MSTYKCVELTEKCARCIEFYACNILCMQIMTTLLTNRFHILCSYLLCEEDMSDFDPKLNNENLNKCLLSLKEFYRDLRHQQVN